MDNQPLNDAKPSGILALNPQGFREVDGVVLDLESFHKHFAPPVQAPAAVAPPPEQTQPAVAQTAAPQAISAQPPGTPAAVFPSDPIHIGWYEVEGESTAYPIMGGVAYRPCGSGSYVGSYLTSYFVTSGSWRMGSGSYLGSGSGSGLLCGGGYGLMLI